MSDHNLFNIDPTIDFTGAISEICDAHVKLLGELNDTVNGLNKSISDIEISQNHLDSHLIGVENLLNGISAQLSLLVANSSLPVPPPAATATAATPTTPTMHPIKGMKLAQFSRKVQDVEQFFQDLHDDIELQGPAFSLDCQKVLYMATFLRETQTTHNWVAGVCISHPTHLDNFKAFMEAFEKHFGSSNKVKEAFCKLKSLKQTGSVSHYAVRFHEISMALLQEEFFLSNIFFEGLKQEVQKWIYGLPNGKEGKLNELITQAIDGDNRLHKWQKTKRSSPSEASPSSSTPSSSTSGPAPMDLSAIRTKPLDSSERECRKRLGLCMYCGGSHTTNNCQLLKEKNDQKAAKGLGKAKPQTKAT
ncbi:hypothetical protein CTheo_8962 [Ceratobasidium theobromae]|uniref:Retrotransposon gag domain-containing protein n=1 Tax=Ceratobasidium theobromae TaxID=1582974 RepID=A0A5N5Q714_9AGAM|nr:hypothetical protein CTheo_8962 [Ceratobasidium theobromae]